MLRQLYGVTPHAEAPAPKRKAEPGTAAPTAAPAVMHKKKKQKKAGGSQNPLAATATAAPADGPTATGVIATSHAAAAEATAAAAGDLLTAPEAAQAHGHMPSGPTHAVVLAAEADGCAPPHPSVATEAAPVQAGCHTALQPVHRGAEACTDAVQQPDIAGTQTGPGRHGASDLEYDILVSFDA